MQLNEIRLQKAKSGVERMRIQPWDRALGLRFYNRWAGEHDRGLRDCARGVGECVRWVSDRVRQASDRGRGVSNCDRQGREHGRCVGDHGSEEQYPTPKTSNRATGLHFRMPNGCVKERPASKPISRDKASHRRIY